MTLRTLLVSGSCASLLLLGHSSYGDPAKAEDECYNMAVRYTQRGFAMSPTNVSGVGPAGYVVKVMIEVTKGLDYLILVGGDKFAKDLDLYVYDEVGQLILDDRRGTGKGGQFAGVKFRADYTGSVEAFVHIAAAQGLASYAVLVGRRGMERGPADVEGLGFEPTFQMRNETPAAARTLPTAVPAFPPKKP
jgi:hypothetical protein